MKSAFFAYLSRMKYIGRWSLMRSASSENVMEHSAQVAHIAHALGVINNTIYGGSVSPDKLASLAVFHESSEVITGDLPTPIKYYNKEINRAYKDLETRANDKLIGNLPYEFRQTYSAVLNPDKETYEYKLLKAADKISAYIKCLEESKFGNKEYALAEETVRQSIEDYNLPEADYFMNNFIDAFRLSLDELN